jgi:hypothetical protein
VNRAAPVRAPGDRAVVHASTLRRVGAGVATLIVPRTRQPVSARSRRLRLPWVRVHPWVWEVALILARGDAQLIHVESATCVIVRNRRHH